jgi:hypothetical protein
LTRAARAPLAAKRDVEPASRESATPPASDPIVREVPWDDPPPKAKGEAAGSEAEPSGAQTNGAPAQAFDSPKVMPK